MNNNKGFSVVELIVVVAIMAVLVGVLAPQFMKFVEQSRRSSDISTAEAIRQAVLADISSENIPGSAEKIPFIGGDTSLETVKANPGQYSTTIPEKPVIRGKSVTDTQFTVSYNTEKGECEVYAGDFCLTNEISASEYKANTRE